MKDSISGVSPRSTIPQRLHALIDAMLLIETDADLDGLLQRDHRRRPADWSGRATARSGSSRATEARSRSSSPTDIDPSRRAAIGSEPHGPGPAGRDHSATPSRCASTTLAEHDLGRASRRTIHRWTGSSACRSRPATVTSSATSTSPTPWTANRSAKRTSNSSRPSAGPPAWSSTKRCCDRTCAS